MRLSLTNPTSTPSLIAKIFFLIIASISPVNSEEVTVKLLNGDTIKGTLIDNSSNNKVKLIEHPQLGMLEIKTASIYSDSKSKAWQSTLDVGFNGTNNGSDNTFAYSLDTKTKYRDNDNKIEFNNSLEKKRVNNHISLNKISTDIRYDRILDNKLSLFTYAEYNFNALNTVGENQVLTAVGLSRSLINSKKHKLSISAGPAVNWFGGGKSCPANSDCEDLIPASLLSVNYNWELNDKIKLEIEDTFSTKYSSNAKIGNDLSTTFRYYPSKSSKFNTSLKYQLNYDNATKPQTNSSYKFLLGTSF